MLLLLVLAGPSLAAAQDLLRWEQLHGFLGGPTDGEYLNDPVIEGGTVYCLRKDGSAFAFLCRFNWDLPEGVEPNARLIWGSDGALYGTTFDGGSPVYGSVFRVKPVALLARQTAGGFTVRLEGFASQIYGLDAADALPPLWSRIATVTNLTGAVEWSETALQPQRRFYRAQLLNP